MAEEGYETVIVGLLPPEIEVRVHARKLLRRYKRNDLGKSIALEYHWVREWFDIRDLMSVVDLPWRGGSSEDFSTLVIRDREIGRALWFDSLREFLEHATGLLDADAAEAAALRVA